uniref:PUM-HD domain-containing protein n=1 Tax=Caenorhabditis japonica TaxID=281687 RepID=H2WKG5_CAEJA
MDQQQLERNGSPPQSNVINGRFYDSPATALALNDSASVTYGGCFNKFSAYTPARSNGFSSECLSAPKHPSKLGATPFGFGNFRTSTPATTPRRQPRDNFDGVRLRLVDFNDTYGSSNTTFSNSFNSSGRNSSKSTLPVWAADAQGCVSTTVTLQDVLDNQSLFEFAADKNGCRFLQEQYPTEGSLHDEIFRKMVEDRTLFLSMCRNMFGNFFIQRIVEFSRTEEQEIVMEHLVTDMFALCLDKSACRVIQLAIQKLEVHLASRLATQLRDTDLVRLSIDQNGNHVIQKIIKTLPVSAWDFVVEFFSNDDNLIAVCQDKYGCRVVQSTIEKLSESETTDCALLQQLMSGITRNCTQLASNEFANYVVQHVVKCGGGMETYRDIIITKCLLRNLLSMSQEKYASHVVEVAFSCAPYNLLCEMMEEIYEGYIPHPETNRDALDILLFHQYGNYVIQQMIYICYSALRGERFQEQRDIDLYSSWLERIKERVFRNSARLERFSSGKKILEALQSAPDSII